MIITLEISLYPLKDEFESYILEFIHALRQHEALTVRTTAMSTLVKGDIDVVFDILKVELKTIYTKLDTSSTVIKIVNRSLPIEDGYYQF